MDDPVLERAVAAGFAEAARRPVNDVRVDLFERLEVETKAAGYVAAPVLHEDVCATHQLEHGLHALGRLHVKHDVALAVVHADVREGEPVLARPALAHHFALRALDLDDVSAQICQ